MNAFLISFKLAFTFIFVSDHDVVLLIIFLYVKDRKGVEPF